MGKPTEDLRRQQHPTDLEAGGGGFDQPPCCSRGILRAFSFRCAFVLVLSAAVLLSALFWLPPFRSVRSSGGDDEKFAAPIQAGFVLHKPLSFLAAHTGRLEYDIFEEIGVPNTKVSVISMHPLQTPNSTYVLFGVLPETRYTPINSVSLSLIKSSLIELLLQQSNLSLTPSIFGQPCSFQILGFPGGITVIPEQSAPIWRISQVLFSFTLNNSILGILQNLNELKGQLKLGLKLRSYENVYVQINNQNGSTVKPPVTVHASVLSGIESQSLLPPRLKQLAQTISQSPAKNLGLSHMIFGKVREVVLSSYLNQSIILSESPAPSPTHADSPCSMPPILSSPVPSLAPPITNPYNSIPCFHCNTGSPSESPLPPPDDWSQPPVTQPPSSDPPSMSPVTLSPRLPMDIPPSMAHGDSPVLPPSIYYSSPPQNDGEYSVAPSFAPVPALSSTSNFAACPWTVILLLFQFLWLWMFHNL